MPTPDYKALFIEALKKNGDNPKWKVGDFVGIKIVPNTIVGRVGQDFIEGLCGAYQFQLIFRLEKTEKE